MKRRTDEVEKKTKDVDRLNKAYEKLMASVVDENMGPLEATIANISKEVVAKTAEAKDLQRAWVTCQTELVALTNENNGLAEKVQVGGSKVWDFTGWHFSALWSERFSQGAASSCFCICWITKDALNTIPATSALS